MEPQASISHQQHGVDPAVGTTQKKWRRHRPRENQGEQEKSLMIGKRKEDVMDVDSVDLGI